MNFKIPSLEKENFFHNIRLEYDSKSIRTYDDYLQYILPTLIREVRQVLKIDQINNLFKIVDKIGTGQYGTVYKGQDKSNSKIYAIKKIRKLNSYRGMNQILRQISLWKNYDWYDSFSNDEINMILNLIKIVWEIYILKKLQIDPIYTIDFHYCIDFNENTNIWLIYEYCNLGELQWKRAHKDDILPQWLEFTQDSQLTVNKFVFDAFWQLANALLFLKQNGIIHRDVKPSNILLNGTTKLLKLSDFGCSILATTDLVFQRHMHNNDNDKQTHLKELYQRELNKIVGTPLFLAPEYCQFDQSKKLFNIMDGFKTDLWSLGVTIFCILHNDLPFCGDNEFDTYSKIVSVSLKDKLNDNEINNLLINEVLEKDGAIRIDIENLVTKLSKIRDVQKLKSGRREPTTIKHETKKKNNRTMKKIFNLFKKNKNDKVDVAKKKEQISIPTNHTVEQVSLVSLESKSFSEESLTPSYSDVRKISSPFSFPESTLESTEQQNNCKDTNGKVCDSVISDDSSCKDEPKPVVIGNTTKLSMGNTNLSICSHTTDDKTPSPLRQDSVHCKSNSSFEVLTPIRKLIRVKNSPDKSTNGRRNRIPLSKEVINFKALNENHNIPVPLNDKESSPRETSEDIKEYLNFADNN